MSLLGGDGSVWVTDTGVASAYSSDQPFQGYIWNDAVTKTHVEKDFIAFKSSTPRKCVQVQQFLNLLLVSNSWVWLRSYLITNIITFLL